MAANLSKVSILGFVRDDAATLSAFHEALFRTLRGLERDHQFEILYVDEGGHDAALVKLKAIADADPRVRVLSLSRPFGKENAIIAGLEHATGAWVVLMDAGGEHPPEMIPGLLAEARGREAAGRDAGRGIAGQGLAGQGLAGQGLAGRDAVVALRPTAGPSAWPARWGRRLLAWCCDAVPPAGATEFVALSRRAVDTLLTIPEHHRSLLGLIYWLDLPRAEVPFQPGPPAGGARRPAAAARFAGGIEHLLAHSRLPLRLAGILGAAVVAIGVFLMFWFPLQGLLRPDTVWFSWCYLIVLIHLVGGGILCGLGIVGEYLVRVLEQVKQRPLYVLKYDSRANTPKTLPFAEPSRAA